jgi:hypothetical protein
MPKNERPKGQHISKDEFEKMMKKYEKNNPKKTKSVNFDKATFQRILDDPATETVSVYFGEEEDGTNTVMIIGLDAEDRLLYATAENKGASCPPYCPS